MIISLIFIMAIMRNDMLQSFSYDNHMNALQWHITRSGS